NFGDGTGFVTTGGVAIPNKKASASCNDKKTATVGTTNIFLSIGPPFDNMNHQSSSSFLPVNLIPANFFFGEKHSILSTPLVDNCCPGQPSCSFLKKIPDGYGCMCGAADFVESVPCHDMEGSCSTLDSYNTYCYDDYGNRLTCPQFLTIPCDSYNWL